MPKGKAWKDKTVKELQAEIRTLTKQVNTRVAGIKLTRELPKDVQQAVNYMKSIAGVKGGIDKTTEAKQEIGLGLKGKTKSELILQARELSSFLRWDIESPEGMRQLEAREKKEWESFSKNHPNWNYEDWRRFVELSGALGSSVMSKFGSETIASDFVKRVQKEDIDAAKYIDAMKETLKEAEGKGKSMEDIVDILRSKL